ncbi:MAG: maleylpyruvate isomerase N-terminal domain-containing protein [Chloroflexota bacterium]
MSALADLERRLAAERADFLAALAALPADATERPVMEDWSARDLVWHVGFWADHGAHAVELALAGRGAAFDYDTDRTDAMNAAEHERGRAASLADALRREAAAYDRLTIAAARLDDTLLAQRLGNGDTVAEVLAYDGPDHYAEHAAHLRSA